MFEEETDNEEDKEKTIDEEGNGDGVEEEKYVKNFLEALDSTTNGNKLKKKLQTDLKDILEATDKEQSKVADILHVLKESDGGKEKEQMGVMFLIQSAVMETKTAPGEWLYNKIANMKKYVSGTDYEMVPPMLCTIFHKMATYYTPQDMLQMFQDSVAVGTSLEKETLEKNQIGLLIKEEEDRIKKNINLVDMKKLKNGFPELGLVIKSIKLADNTCAYPCPLDNCDKAFVSLHTCDAHLNRHLGYEYGLCGTCGYTNPSRDLYDKHKCFVGIKTGGKRPVSRGQKARKRIAEKKEQEQKEEKVQKVESGSSAPKKFQEETGHDIISHSTE